MWWNWGSMVAFLIIIQSLSGFLLIFLYMPETVLSFYMLQKWTIDTFSGSFLRLIHMNFASFIFLFLYLHMLKGIYLNSWKHSGVWTVGVLLLIFLMLEAFLGYVLPFGSMSYWGLP